MKRPLRHRLDRIIRERLEGLHPPYDPTHWEQLEEQLDGGALEDEVPAGRPELGHKELDAALFEKMHRYEAPYQGTHWAQMEQKLQRVFEWPALVLRYKALEVALTLLLFLGLWQHLPTTPGLTDIQAFRIPMLPAQQQAEGAANDDNRAGQAAGQPSADRTAPETETATTSSSTAIAGRPASKLSTGDGSPVTLPFLPARTPNLKASRGRLSSLPDGLSLAGLPEQATTQAAMVAPIDRLEPSALSYDRKWLNGVQAARAKRATVLRLGMFGNGEYNHILVPASEDQRLSESFERAAWGYGGGLSLSVDFGRVELGTGLVYAARRYPVGIVYLEGSVAEGFEGDELRTTELNIVNLPIHLRYDMVQRGKWRGYILGGAAVQVAFQTSYFTADAPPQYNFRPAMPIPTDGGSDGAEKAIDRIRQNGVGWFEGGSFKDNAYLTANFGFGVERFISDRWSLFAQPVYQHSFHYFKNIDGLGPNKDRINSLSVLFGTRVRLK
ncbi:MAG: hypothetical protein GVY26_13655 [Bacteroidetes bacterium]|jgi:hypothetical protein|nr:hypothetical protein [Bacteroidota bacterium]